MGGRIATFRKGNYVADLGAMVVTGLGELMVLFCWLAPGSLWNMMTYCAANYISLDPESGPKKRCHKCAVVTARVRFSLS